ncbi:MAG: hypothetical protein WBY94_19560, partial [Polyangiaceae bacterium]
MPPPRPAKDPHDSSGGHSESVLQSCVPPAQVLWQIGPSAPPPPPVPPFLLPKQHTPVPAQFWALVHAMATVPAGQAPGSAHELPPSSPSPWPAIATQHTCGAVQVVVVQGIDPRAAVPPLPAALAPAAPPLPPPR